ncbi:hypothetical protein [Novipirellula artificiosorum]|uniref:Uncharacterized protein n=1 Tax=Novipirellula artificiosorum TaxID=2528016 RepID=A0A5C6E4X0_9BACT|nr:hypothetical protein [Novipirellula artificiosorum]TWU42631.1 hypothetical protein Poly41_09300 [Novipirellula artificiosorum]
MALVAKIQWHASQLFPRVEFIAANKHTFWAVDKAFETAEEVYAEFKNTPEGRRFTPRATFHDTGRADVHWAESRTITTFDRVVCRDARTDQLLWSHNVGPH